MILIYNNEFLWDNIYRAIFFQLRTDSSNIDSSCREWVHCTAFININIFLRLFGHFFIFFFFFYSFVQIKTNKQTIYEAPLRCSVASYIEIDQLILVIVVDNFQITAIVKESVKHAWWICTPSLWGALPTQIIGK